MTESEKFDTYPELSLFVHSYEVEFYSPFVNKEICEYLTSVTIGGFPRFFEEKCFLKKRQRFLIEGVKATKYSGRLGDFLICPEDLQTECDGIIKVKFILRLLYKTPYEDGYMRRIIENPPTLGAKVILDDNPNW